MNQSANAESPYRSAGGPARRPNFAGALPTILSHSCRPGKCQPSIQNRGDGGESVFVPGLKEAGSGFLEVRVVAGQSTVTSAWSRSPLKLLLPRPRGPSVWAYL